MGRCRGRLCDLLSFIEIRRGAIPVAEVTTGGGAGEEAVRDELQSTCGAHAVDSSVEPCPGRAGVTARGGKCLLSCDVFNCDPDVGPAYGQHIESNIERPFSVLGKSARGRPFALRQQQIAIPEAARRTRQRELGPVFLQVPLGFGEQTLGFRPATGGVQRVGLGYPADRSLVLTATIDSVA